MFVSRFEDLASARKLVRTFATAPNPRRQARSIHSELAHWDGWTGPEREQIDALGAWLADDPNLAELRPRCEQILAKLRWGGPWNRCSAPDVFTCVALT